MVEGLTRFILHNTINDLCYSFLSFIENHNPLFSKNEIVSWWFHVYSSQTNCCAQMGFFRSGGSCSVRLHLISNLWQLMGCLCQNETYCTKIQFQSLFLGWKCWMLQHLKTVLRQHQHQCATFQDMLKKCLKSNKHFRAKNLFPTMLFLFCDTILLFQSN